ncbi:hypothetical protein NB689_003553 [Xanthomonas sacchari]|nr:hypothetical protein [Xanthomonas sacchari]
MRRPTDSITPRAELDMLISGYTSKPAITQTMARVETVASSGRRRANAARLATPHRPIASRIQASTCTVARSMPRSSIIFARKPCPSRIAAPTPPSASVSSAVNASSRRLTPGLRNSPGMSGPIAKHSIGSAGST